MNEEIKTILEEMRFKASIYGDHKKRGLSFNDDEKNCALLLEYIKQRENIIKEVREYTKEMQVYCIEFESWGVPSKELLEILEKENKE